MLPEVHRYRYEKFQQALERLLVTADEGTAVSEALQEVQQFFGEQILGMSVEELDERLASRVLSIQTEMHKQLRLLGTEVMFLVSSRNSATAVQRRSGLCDRIKILIGYCDVLLEE